MVDFAGWSMPVQYNSIVAEHQATRRAAGLFDVSHMGRLRLDGDGAAALLDKLLTRRVVGLEPGKIRYSLVCSDRGGILDDVLVYHLESRAGGDYHLLVVNASNRTKISDWIDSHLRSWGEVKLTDRTTQTAMIAVQGPEALRFVQPLVEDSIGNLDYYTGMETTIAGQTGIVSRTGYTGEDGCELIVSAASAIEVWEAILHRGRADGVMPAGLGARDTLRLEAGMPLYGHELTESINPIQAGLSFAVNLKDRDFTGRDAIASAKHDEQQPVRVGLVLGGRRAAREHYPVVARREGEAPAEPVGEITSGTFSPTLQKPIAMAYVKPEFAAAGTELAVDIRGTLEPAQVVKLPFYTRPH
jgi:aminomethyltransferase